ncbi:PREDICTED: putative odorant-binding protein A10 [Atta cephalotes]|uniref:Uncharacterized protein n=1 Tax=Atta cephalotes TaxID=12957 RepID=A0A158NC38_ATTCE|nr:PREDICTED: putative odorant-binding protein A10 [Atta cephalotes]
MCNATREEREERANRDWNYSHTRRRIAVARRWCNHVKHCRWDIVGINKFNVSPRASPAIRILVLACALLVTAMATESDSEGQQSGRSRVSDEQLNVALSDKRYLNRQLKCALGEAPCDPVGRRLKSLVPLVLRGSCPQCSPEETRQIKKVLSHIQRSFPKEWNRIVQQYAGVL